MTTKRRKRVAKNVEPVDTLSGSPELVVKEFSDLIVAVQSESVAETVPEIAADAAPVTPSAELPEAGSEAVPESSGAKMSSASPDQVLLYRHKFVLEFQQLMKEKPWLVFLMIFTVPLTMFLLPKILLPVMLVVLTVFTYQELSKYFPAGPRQKFERWVARLRYVNKYGGYLYYGVGQIRPFLMAGVALWSGPLIVIGMFFTYVAKLFCKREKYVRADLFSPDKIIIEQSVSKPVEDESDANFYHSPAFAITLMAIFTLGIPAAATIGVYNFFGIDALLGYPSRDPQFTKVIILIGFYISSICWCMSALFFRAWFTYPLNFSSTAYDVVLDENFIEKKNIKGWFAELIWFCYPEYLPVKIKWKDLDQVKITEGGFGRLYPLPDSLFSRESLVYGVLNKIAAFTDAIVDRVGRCDYVEFRTLGAAGQSIKLRLWQMNKDDRARVFYAIRKWAPLVVIPDGVQQALLGTSVLAETRYTQIWFDLLTSNAVRQRRDLLDAGDVLRAGSLTVTGKLDSGGQANVYLARNAEDQSVVIKEFILTGDDDMGNLIESAADFENEGSILVRLDHPNIVKLQDVFTEDRRVYLVLEHVEGQSLRQLVAKEGPICEAEAIRLGREMCKVLTYLHSIVPPIVHRDFTPDNIILMPDGSIKVIDFSVAGSSVNVKDGDCVGKHSYTPAEQFRGQPCPQSDLYALGATLYFLTVGADPPPITQLHPAVKVDSLSPRFDEIVAKLTANALHERFETSAWVEVELSALQEDSYIIV